MQRLFAFVLDELFPSASTSCFPPFQVAVQSKSLIECFSIRWWSFIKSNCHFSFLYPVNSLFVGESRFVTYIFRNGSKDWTSIDGWSEKRAHFMKEQIWLWNVSAAKLTPGGLRAGFFISSLPKRCYNFLNEKRLERSVWWAIFDYLVGIAKFFILGTRV